MCPARRTGRVYDMSTGAQRREIARRHAAEHRHWLATHGGPSCAWCGLMGRNWFGAVLHEAADGSWICSICIAEAARGAKMTRDVT